MTEKNDTVETFYHWYESPVGPLFLSGSSEALQMISFPCKEAVAADHWQKKARPFRDVCKQLDSYFKGRLKDFDLPLAPQGTPFQQNVWQALLTIPYGQTCSYAEIARQIDSPKAVRAVGNANGRNPIPIIIPCHRVIGSTGSLTGFGGGLPTKTYLLNLENPQLEMTL